VERPGSVKTTHLRIYLRQSKNQKTQAESIATQRAECKRLAFQLGITPEEWEQRIEYIEIDRSGDDFKGREQLARLLQEAQPGDIILAWRQSRLGRDAIDIAATVRELVKFRGCTLYTVESGVAPVSMKGAEDAMMVMFRGMRDQGELENTRKNTRDGLRSRARDGFATGSLPYGYRTVLVNPNVTDRKQSKKRIEIDEKPAANVRRIFDLYLAGNGSAGIAKILNREGVLSPKGHGWSPACIWDMLRDSAYAGHWAYGKTRVVGREGKRTIQGPAPESEIIRHERPELAILTPEMWARVQTAIVERRRDVGQMATAKHPLSGTLRCGLCGGPMRIKVCDGRRPDWKKRYYVCGKKLNEARCTNSIHVPADMVEDALSVHIRTRVLEQILDKMLEEIRVERQRVVHAAEERASEADQLRADLEALAGERKRLVKLAAATDDPVPEVVEMLRANQDRARTLERSLAIATKPPMEVEVAQRLEAAAGAHVERMRQQLDAVELRAALISLFPKGLTFKVDGGVWLLEGSASVPAINVPDSASGYRTVEGGATIRYETRVLPLLILLGMVQVPAGTFAMGGGDEEDERPKHRVFVSAFSIDRDEVTRAAYQKCVAAGACTRADGEGDDDLPVTGVSFLDAASYCAWAGKRLPTEAEWEKAARGSDGRIYPWGDEPSCEQANFGNFQGEGRCPKNPGRPAKVGSYPGASPFGVRDLAGNVWEWVADWYDAKYYRHSPSHDPRGPRSGERRVVRGGACCSMFDLPRAANRLAFPESYRDIDIGFRCAK
jgi:formylglycine-generating enzyme required for sulfatase activity/DNA invertase Pin-like site-specific DNA recombinase